MQRILLLPILSAAAFSQALMPAGVSSRSAALGGTYLDGDVTSAMSINPAGLALTGGRQAEFHLMSAFAQGSFQNTVDANGSLRPSLGTLPYGALALPVGKSRLTLGAAFLPETLMSAHWTYTDPPGTAGASWGRFDHQSEIAAMRTSFGASWFFSPRLSIGFTAGWVYNTNTLVTPYVFQQHPALRGLKTALDLHTTGSGYNANFGFLAHPTHRLEIGASYKTRTAIPTTGTATGTLDRQLAAIGLAARPDYRYDARVDNRLPATVMLNFSWQARPRLRLAGQMDWVQWSGAFKTLPVMLTNGNNADVNGLLGVNYIKDGVPLDWKDQFVWRGAAETPLSDNWKFRAGGFFTQTAVPSSTLSPLTAAIQKNGLTTGVGYKRGRWSTDCAYVINLPSEARTRTSALAAGEYSNTRIRLTVHSVLLSAGLRF
jgi:long-chain fatty acid transport protein